MPQSELSQAVEKIVAGGLFPVLLGGGHDIAWGHYDWIIKTLSRKPASQACTTVGIINSDAHFDLRPYKDDGNSGSSFLQIADHCREAGEEFSYFCVGIQRSANTNSLFQTADELGVTLRNGQGD